jgi:hypothetical protein
VVSIVACTGDWTGGWDNSDPEGADRFIAADGQSGRLVEIIGRGEPACLLAHWTGIWWNGRELGFRIFQEVVRRLEARYDHLLWMKLAEIARYWAARELTRIAVVGKGVEFEAPFACPAFTVRVATSAGAVPRLRRAERNVELQEISGVRRLASGTWCREGEDVLVCFDLGRGANRMEWGG